jgi:hypothetical protein
MRRASVFLRATLAATIVCGPTTLFASPLLSLRATDLDGGGFALPGALTSERTLLLIGFRHDDQSALDGWRDGLKLLEADQDWLEVPVIPVTSPLVQPMIRSGMRRRFATAAQRTHVAILFAAPTF